jgi:hypothetical protein
VTVARISIHATNDAQRQLARQLFGFGKVAEQRTYVVALDVAQRLQAASLKASGKTVSEHLSANLKVRSTAKLPEGAILCVVEQFGAEPTVEKHVWPADRRVPTAKELQA